LANSEGRIFVTGPDVVKSVTGEDIDILSAGLEAHKKIAVWHM
jgi:acetyl-CoA/propionyl-CoA carboxylase carboxyl transferase subunit